MDGEFSDAHCGHYSGYHNGHYHNGPYEISHSRQQWSKWSPCSLSKGKCEQMRSYKCNNECSGTVTETRLCENSKCLASCWSVWYDWSGCSMSCGGGKKRRFKVRINNDDVTAQICTDQALPREVIECNTHSCF